MTQYVIGLSPRGTITVCLQCVITVVIMINATRDRNIMIEIQAAARAGKRWCRLKMELEH